MVTSSQERTQHKRERARSKGLCIVCCIRTPDAGRTACEPCNEAAKTRMQQVRIRRKERRLSADRARTYEAAGDSAAEQFAHAEAAMQYERSLKHIHTIEDEVRIYEKIARSLFRSARPDLAAPWHDRARERCEKVKALHERSVVFTLSMPVMRWLESRTC